MAELTIKQTLTLTLTYHVLTDSSPVPMLREIRSKCRDCVLCVWLVLESRLNVNMHLLISLALAKTDSV